MTEIQMTKTSFYVMLSGAKHLAFNWEILRSLVAHSE